MNYNRKGLIESGSYIQDGNIVRFHYHYHKVSKLDGELLRAEFVLPHMAAPCLGVHHLLATQISLINGYARTFINENCIFDSF